MARYYMHSCNGHGFTEDEVGIELPDRQAAMRKAVEAARDIMSHDVRSGILDLTSFIEVEDEQHNLIFTLTFLEAVTISNQYANDRPSR
jgi:hypothetical protein